VTIINYNNYKAVQVLYCIGKCCDDATLMQLIKAYQLVYCMGLLVVSATYVYKCILSTQPHKICLVVDMDGSVHNRTNLEKVTPVPEVSTPILSTQPHKMCLGVGMDDSVYNRTRYV
jgi:hypothetical protein